MAPHTTSAPEPPIYVFSPRELQRLAAYRAAVVAGFYNDKCDTTRTSRFSSTKPASVRRISR